MGKIADMVSANRYKQHQQLVNKLVCAFQREFPHGRIFERHVGLFYTRAGYPVKINIAGMSDLWALVEGKHFEIEVKTGSGVLSKPQKAWKKTVEKLSCHFILARDIDTTMDIIKKALGEKG